MFLKKMQISRRMSGRPGLSGIPGQAGEKQKENRSGGQDSLTSRVPGYIVSVREECL
jgi:hypothetical protein